MSDRPDRPLRTGFTTGACATAAAAGACGALLAGCWTGPVGITLPRGRRVDFPLSHRHLGDGWAEAGVIKDAGDDPDVTHGCEVRVRVEPGVPGAGVTFAAGPGVGTITRPGLPVPVGEPAINPVPRAMMTEAISALAAAHGVAADFLLTISIPTGAKLAAQTWNPRLGIEGGLSILGTTGIVRPFSCSAWIASIHSGVDVARAGGLSHVCGATGNTSEATAQAALGLPDHAMLDMGDFAGGLLKYMRNHPVARLTIAGGFGKLTKLAQGALDLHSGRSQVDFGALADLAAALGADRDRIASSNTAAEALDQTGAGLARVIAERAGAAAHKALRGAPVTVDVMVVGRDGAVLAHV